MVISKKEYQQILIMLVGLIILLGCVSAITIFYINQHNSSVLVNDSNTDNFETLPSQFLQSEEAVIMELSSTTGYAEMVVLPIDRVLFEYVEVVDGCGVHFEGECLNVRSGPGEEFPVIAQLRNNIVLKVGGQIEYNGKKWYKIVFDEWLRYPERLKGDWYVSADYVQVLYSEGDSTIWENNYSTTTNKSITVDRSEQKLYAFEGNELFMEISISTGLELTPTPRGIFTIFKKTPSRYMQGPLPNLSSRQVYDLPGVPWNLYFTHGGAVIHGAYWHNSFGTAYSHGCVNVEPDLARKLYDWAPLGTEVIVKD